MLQQSVQCVGGMATMPSRVHTFKIALETILPQVDRLYLYLDKYAEVPETLPRNPKIVPLLSSEFGALGADGKFLGTELHTEPCLYFGFDDDIVYPPNYVKWLTSALRRHRFKAMVGIHGLIFQPPHQSYRRDRIIQHFKSGSLVDCHVDELGSGTIAFHSQMINIRPRNWRHHNMSDLMVAIEAMQQQIPRITVRRPAHFLRALEESQPDSIWSSLKQDDSRETAIMQAALAAFPEYWQYCEGVVQSDSTKESLGFIDDLAPGISLAQQPRKITAAVRPLVVLTLAVSTSRDGMVKMTK